MKFENSRMRTRIAIVLLGLLSVSSVGLLTINASADERPAAAVPAFFADRCEGTTFVDPSVSGPSELDQANLLEVDGSRLTAYNEGRVVPLYDHAGAADSVYPPICAVYYDAVIDGPVTEWMFCTDIESKVCANMVADWGLAEEDHPVNPMTNLSGNPRLDADQERIIAWLTQHGSRYEGFGYYSWNGVDRADAHLGSYNRLALQTLIWCISDPTYGSSSSEPARKQTCEASIGVEEQARILALVPDAEAEQVLSVSPASATVPAGETAELTITTSVFGQPIKVSGSTARVELCEAVDGVSFEGGELVVQRGADDEPREVKLCVTPEGEDRLEISASVLPVRNSNLTWNQSQDNGSTTCQVFAAFRSSLGKELVAEAVVNDVPVPTSPTPTEPTSPTPTEPTSPTPTEPTSPTPTEPTSPTPTEPTSPTPTEPTSPTPTEPTSPTPTEPKTTTPGTPHHPVQPGLPQTGI